MEATTYPKIKVLTLILLKKSNISRKFQLYYVLTGPYSADIP